MEVTRTTTSSIPREIVPRTPLGADVLQRLTLVSYVHPTWKHCQAKFARLKHCGLIAMLRNLSECVGRKGLMATEPFVSSMDGPFVMRIPRVLLESLQW